MEMNSRRQMGVPQPKQFEITPGVLEFLIMHAVRDPAVFQLCNAELDPDMLSKPSEMPYRHIWRAITDFYREHGQMPGLESLSMRALGDIESDPLSKADPATGGKLYENAVFFIDWCFDKVRNPDEAMEPHEARNVMRHILIDRGPEEDLRRAVTHAVGRRIINLPALVEQAQRRIQDIASLGLVEEDEVTCPMTWAHTSGPKWPTGVSFVDSVMEGGGQPGDCNVIIGPTGGGKTTLAMQLACSTARLQNQLERRGVDGDPGLVVYVSYEDARAMLQIRSTSYGARVLKDRLRFLESDAELSRTGNLQDYEKLMYAREGNPAEMLGEVERIEQIRPWLNKYLVLVDHHDPAKGGRGHVTEVAHKLTAIQQKHGMPIRMVVLDWAGIMMSNYLQATQGKIEGSGLSLELQNLINRAKQEIAAPFNTTVWIPHQLKGTLTDRAPAKLPHHSEAQWCSMFADHAWYAFVLGTKDKEHSVCQFGASKTRHGETPAPTILKIDGAFCRMVDVSEHFEVDDVSHRLTPRSEAAKVHTQITRRRTMSSADIDS